VAVKLGADGVYVDSLDGCAQVPGVPVAEVVDTVGAGDGFAAGLISALLEGRSAVDAARRGAWIGAQVVQRRGDTEGLPTRVALEAAGV
jgi:dehydrogluconokinase